MNAPRAIILLGAMVSVGVLGGCAKYLWVRSDYTPQTFARESYECERDMRQSGYFGGGIVGQMNAQDFFDRCMVAKGWTKTRVE